LKIIRVSATPLNIPVTIDVLGLDKTTSLSLCLTEIETDTGLVGHGMTAITEEEIIAAAVREVAGPALIGEDPMATERLWEKLYWLLSPRGQTGYASHAIAALDIALWDLKAKALGQPLWRLLGGARSRVPVYATFGFGFFDREQLAGAAKKWVADGFRRLKMTVAGEALKHKDERPLMDVIREDARRVAAVREAVGPEVEIFIDANCNLDLYHAQKLVEMIRPLNISFFEEPLTQNDVLGMAQLRRNSGIALACGQNEGLLYRFRDLLAAQAIDYAQPNVCITGGFTQCVKIAALAASYNVSVANGGAWSYHNMHLQAGVANGSLVEHHYLAVELYKTLYRDLPMPKDGWLTLPDRPGLGFEPNRDAIKEIAKLPLSSGRGKG
jgi:L-alanine-DL-glutamate epimerase-like enolase superfamily enzyme